MGKKFRTASLNSKFTGSYKKVYPNANLLTKLLTLAQKNIDLLFSWYYSKLVSFMTL